MHPRVRLSYWLGCMRSGRIWVFPPVEYAGVGFVNRNRISSIGLIELDRNSRLSRSDPLRHAWAWGHLAGTSGPRSRIRSGAPTICSGERAHQTDLAISTIGSHSPSVVANEGTVIETGLPNSARTGIAPSPSWAYSSWARDGTSAGFDSELT